jgi:hypothetical protein
LNPRPPGSQPGALPTELRPPWLINGADYRFRFPPTLGGRYATHSQHDLIAELKQRVARICRIVPGWKLVRKNHTRSRSRIELSRNVMDWLLIFAVLDICRPSWSVWESSFCLPKTSPRILRKESLRRKLASNRLPTSEPRLISLTSIQRIIRVGIDRADRTRPYPRKPHGTHLSPNHASHDTVRSA